MSKEEGKEEEKKEEEKKKQVKIPITRYNRYGIEDLYKFYKANCKEAGIAPINRLLYKRVLRAYNKRLLDVLMTEEYEEDMGNRLGYLGLAVKKNSSTCRKVDYNNSKKLGFTVYHDNSKTMNQYFILYWNKDKVANDSYYQFRLSEANKKKLTKLVRENKIIATK